MRPLLLPFLAALVLASGAAAAPLPTLPSVTTPTVSVPAVTTPVVTTPAVTTPSVTTPPLKAPPVTTPAATVPSVKVAPPPSPRGTPSPPVDAPAAPATPDVVQTPAAAPAPAPVAHSGRPAQARRVPARRPLTAAHFRLARGGAVRVTVWQERPRCRFFGRYTVAGGRGENALPVPQRIGRRRVVAGEYLLVAVAGQRTVVDLRVRITRTKGHLHVGHATLASTCAERTERAILFDAAAPLRPAARSHRQAQTGRSSRSAAAPPGGRPFLPPPLTVRVERAVRQTLLYVLLAVAIALFAGAAFPRAGAAGAGAALARHRSTLTSAGLALIAAAVLAAFLR